MSQQDEDNNQPTAAWSALLAASDDDTKVIRMGSEDQSTAMIFKRVPEVPEGFPMGSRSIGYAQPVTRVVIEQEYWLSAFPITQLQWRKGVEWIKQHPPSNWKELETINKLDPNPSRFKGDYLPVENVSWDDIRVWSSALSKLLDLGESKLELRLPYESEWEWACRAVRRTDGKYQACTWEFNGLNHFGDGEPALEKCGWFEDNSESSTQRVGQKDPNALGLYDMHGNVWEWCTDLWLENYSGYWDGITMQELISVNSGGGNGRRVVRGGGWFNSAWWCQSANRNRWWPDDRGRGRGFRVGLFPGPNRASSSKTQADWEQRREAGPLRDSAESQRDGLSSMSLPPRSGRNF
ncbi:MAG: formylglycine-generating enzyme family protein [Planctomycetota bacterium]